MPGGLDPDVAVRIVESAVHPFCLIDESGTITWAGPGIEQVGGYRPEELVGRSVLDFVAESDRSRIAEALAAIRTGLDGGPPEGWEAGSPTVEVQLADGATIRAQLSIATAARTGLRGFVLQLRRADSEDFLHGALEAMAADRPLDEVLARMAATAGTDLPWLRTSVAWAWDGERFALAVGTFPDVGLDRAWGRAVPWADAGPGGFRHRVDELPAEMAAAAREAGATTLFAQALRRDGGPVGLVVGWHVAPWEMTVFTEAAVERTAHLVELALTWDASRHALAEAAAHDPLTGLPNRRAFLSSLEAATSSTVALLYLDLDDFKPVNDDHGHDVGDAVLAVTAARLRAAVRPTDVVARLGGDEFAVLCPATDAAAACVLAGRLSEEVRRPVVLDGVAVEVGLSIGIAVTEAGHVDPDDLVRRADAALRRAKRDGKGRWRVDGTTDPDRAEG
ncbi:MAG: diguanylate cyclase [Acidimicrobiia bacterium]